MIKHWLIGAAALAVVSAASPYGMTGTAFAGDLPPIRCAANDKIDGTSVDSARAKLNAAGYSKVRNLKKGCDNFWHGSAIKDGSATHVSLSPGGEALSEGD